MTEERLKGSATLKRCRDCGIELNGSNRTRHLIQNGTLWCSNCEKSYWAKKRQEGKVWHQKHRQESRKVHSLEYLKNFETYEKYQLKIKQDVVNHYSNGTGKCARCGFENIWALSIDHINGNGSQERRELKVPSGSRFYVWLRKNNWPSGYQILCMNCQRIKAMENHEHWRLQRQRPSLEARGIKNEVKAVQR